MDLFTLGHSNHSFDRFLDLLDRYAIEQVVDVRSVPFSRRHPQFSRSKLAADLSDHGIDYVFLGNELGAREHRIAILCAEKEPLDCHRAILVARRLVLGRVRVQHILADRALERAYEIRGREIAWSPRETARR